MMRCVVFGLVLMGATGARAFDGGAAGAFVALCAAQAEDVLTLRLDTDLVHETAETLSSHGLFVPMAQAAQPKPATKGAGSGGTGGPQSLPPQLSGVGLGIQVGSPTSVTIKFGGVQQNGFVVGLGAGFRYGGGPFATSLSLHADYLWHLVTLVRDAQLAVTGYVGLGLWVALGGAGYGLGYFGPGYIPGFNFFGVGVRVPLGLSMSFQAAPIEIYLELDPAVFVFPGIDVGVGASLGFRYHF